MKTNIEEVRAQINEARARLANAEAELAKMEAKPAKWEPKGGEWYLSAAGRVQPGVTDCVDAKAGSEYPTREAAESALHYVTFYKRLCCLAQELNPSGKVGGDWFVGPPLYGDHEWSAHRWEFSLKSYGALFETELAALRAAEIMNRDNWQLP